LIRAPLSTTSVLDEATEVVGLTASPWAALLILTEIPYRFLQAVFVDQLIALGAEATHYGRLLQSTADLVIVAFVLAVAGRAVYARACRLASQSGANPGREALRLSLPALLSFLVTSGVTELLFYAGSITVLAIPVIAVVRGLATGTYELNDAPGVLRPFRLIARYGREVRIATALVIIFTVALFVAFVNVAGSFSIGVALAGAAGVRAARWSTMFSFENRRLVLMTFAGALIAIQPFWIAANVLLVRKAGVEETGEDLRTWFRALRNA
jgi:hypothetical protein